MPARADEHAVVPCQPFIEAAKGCAPLCTVECTHQTGAPSGPHRPDPKGPLVQLQPK